MKKDDNSLPPTLAEYFLSAGCIDDVIGRYWCLNRSFIHITEMYSQKEPKTESEERRTKHGKNNVDNYKDLVTQLMTAKLNPYSKSRSISSNS